MSTDDAPLHPRPLFAREAWIDLRGPWEFAYDDDDLGRHQHWERCPDRFTREIIVPFPPESPASRIHDPSYHPIMWYRRVVDLEPLQEDQRRLIHFGAVDYAALVWVNGDLVASHEGGNSPFSADITDHLVPGRAQVIVVRAEDVPSDLTQPRGKQDWREKPHDIWYERTSGIWQPVWIETVGNTYIRALAWIPDLDRAVLRMSLTLRRRKTAKVSIHVQLTLHGASLANDTYDVYGQELRRDLALDLDTMTMSRGDALWSPGRPNLIDAVVTVYADDQITDRMHSYAGLRRAGTAGGRFMLNGEPYYLRMVLEQGYWPESHLAAPSDEALRREVELIRSLGFNGVRIHQKVEDPRFLYWCDKLGLLVWGEMANAYVFNRIAVDRFTEEWLQVVEQNFSHPCIITWVPINESWGVPNLLRDESQKDFVRSMYYLTKAMDSTRPVIGNDGWEYLVGDIFGIHDYTPFGAAIRERYGTREAVERTLSEVQPGRHFVALSDQSIMDRPVMLTEFGGLSYAPEDTENWFGYSTVTSAEEYLEQYRDLLQGVLDCSALSGFCYTQLTDTGQETNGLLNADRTPKLDPRVIYDITRGPSMAVPADIIAQQRKVRASPFPGTVHAAENNPDGETASPGQLPTPTAP